MSPDDKKYYATMAHEALAKYDVQLMEYCATGTWSPFTTFKQLTSNRNGVTYGGPWEQRMGNNGPWVRMPYKKKNDLE